MISPDKGAVARAGEVAALLGVPVYVASKNRDPQTGRLTDYSLDADLAPGAYLVVDDIFDGGGTFALLAGAVPDGVVLDLWVTHGGFTKPDFSAAARARYRRIYTTDSLSSAVAAGLADSQIQVTALGPWITAAVQLGELAGAGSSDERPDDVHRAPTPKRCCRGRRGCGSRGGHLAGHRRLQTRSPPAIPAGH